MWRRTCRIGKGDLSALDGLTEQSFCENENMKTDDGMLRRASTNVCNGLRALPRRKSIFFFPPLVFAILLVSQCNELLICAVLQRGRCWSETQRIVLAGDDMWLRKWLIVTFLKVFFSCHSLSALVMRSSVPGSTNTCLKMDHAFARMHGPAGQRTAQTSRRRCRG